MKTVRARSNDRGMTLVEVLMSLAILSAMTAAVVPLLRDSLRSLETNQNDSAGNLFELSMRADQVIDDHRTGTGADIGLDEVESGTPQSIAWPEPHSEWPPVVVRRLERKATGDDTIESGQESPDANDPESESIGSGWWTFEWRGIAVSRWIPGSEEEAHE